MDYLETAEEAAPKSFLYTLMLTSSPTRTIEENLPLSDKVYIIETNIIRELAEKGDCVIVGRCADFILRDRTDCLNVFIHAAMDKKVERIVKLYGETADKPEKRLMDKDKKRRVNYRYYTDREWGASQNYHLCLDSGEFGIEKCAQIIVDLAK